jgi:hypothetical protein
VFTPLIFHFSQPHDPTRSPQQQQPAKQGKKYYTLDDLTDPQSSTQRGLSNNETLQQFNRPQTTAQEGAMYHESRVEFAAQMAAGCMATQGASVEGEQGKAIARYCGCRGNLTATTVTPEEFEASAKGNVEPFKPKMEKIETTCRTKLGLEPTKLKRDFNESVVWFGALMAARRVVQTAPNQPL